MCSSLPMSTSPPRKVLNLHFSSPGKVLGLGGDVFAPWVKVFVSPLLALVGEGIIEPLLQLFGFDIGLVKVRLIDIDAAKPVLIL